ncbi:beta-fructofuranosidase, insoluble isoenzyme 1-like [Coffea eugenioides]|uniref:Beta-fructofuranosidase, insoluble isoenzyme 1-like isoform X1 n=1 Tax=Coffea arabica TaxID=13443 RepID=A0A6P6T487_COFAR|nr:beta-fructofuranosidase, insoluble isoenzyme 1-like isoform X1 [Coffea arabica]XP_027175513.1 beta-fructofuranosidase, insoluble isoenzyme 1-like [Coffea eugenioides]
MKCYYCDHELVRALSLVFVCLLLSLLSIKKVDASHQVYPEYQTLPAVKVKQLEHRTGYHFQPQKHWINDPNGPMYYNGIYHLFYQHNPYGAVWGNIVWGHSVSMDLINWKALKPAIKPTKPYDKHGCWSGSATILPGNKPVILYTGVVDENQTQVQNYVLPANISDPYLEEWIKPDDNPLVVAEPGVNRTAFRDPTTAWMGRDGHWRILIGSRRKHTGIAYLYKSKDFIKWVKAKHPLHSKDRTGNWECPDFFPVAREGKKGLDNSMIEEQNVKFVLKVSLDTTRYDYYTVGKYFPEIDRYIPDNTSVDGWKGLRYDCGNFYASKSFFDASKNRRILWGWSNESDTKMDDVEKGWAGIQTIPRRIWLHPNGKQLLAWPIEEVESLRGHKVQLRNENMKKGDVVEIKGITAAQADVEVVFSFPSLDKAERLHPSLDHLDAHELCSRKGSSVHGGLGPFGLLTLASGKLDEYTPVFVRVFKAKNKHKILLCSDASSSSLKKGLYKPSFAGFLDVDLAKKKLSLRSLIDHSVVESFGAGGEVCITSRVYPALAVSDNAHLYAFNNGSETVAIETLDAWSMKGPKLMN